MCTRGLRRSLPLAGVLLLLACEADRGTPAGAVSTPLEAAGGETSDPEPAPAAHSQEFLSPVFHVSRKWRSMEGPSHNQPVALSRPKRPELLWITGYRVSVVDRDGRDGVSQEFMCHNNLDLNASEHARIFGWSSSRKHGPNSRLFTLSQGQFEIALPEGFGIPVRSDESVSLSSQVLNHNVENPDVHVRHNVEVDFRRDEDLASPLKPLYQSAIQIMVSLEDAEVYYGVKDPEAAHEGTSCSVGDTPANLDHTDTYKDEFGRRFAGHWVLKPGREVRHTLVTKQLNLTFDTRIHFIAVHLHPFAESVELRDVTTGRSLWTGRARGPETGIGLVDVDSFASAEGIPLYVDHEYELVSVYENTSGIDQDAMAALFLYLHDLDGAKSIESMRRMREWAKESG